MSTDLLEIQRLDVAVDQLRHRRTHLLQRAALEAALADQQTQQAAIDEVAAARVEVATRQRKFEDEAQILSDKADTDESRLYGGEVSGLKDLEALQHEIATLRERQAEFEDQALEAMEEAETLASRIVELEAARAGTDQQIAELESEIAELESEIDTEIGGLTAERARAVEGADHALITEYERLRPAFGAATVVTFDGSTCVGCPSTMPAMEVDRLKHLDGTDPASCTECGRIVLR